MSTYEQSVGQRWHDTGQSARSLKDLVVVELAGSSAGAHCAKLLGDLGANVVCVEPPGGAPLRNSPAAWAAWTTSRTTLGHDAPTVSGWLRRADVIIESTETGLFPEHFVGGEFDLSEVPGSTVRVRLSPFGSMGPYAQWTGADIVDQALGGHLYLSGMPDREPIQGPRGQAALAAGVYGAIGAMAALHSRDRGSTGGAGQTVEVTHHEALASLHQFTDVRFTHAGNVLKRMGNRYAGPGSPIGMYRAADGFMALTVSTAAHAELLLAICGLDHLLEHPEVSSITDLMVNPALFEPAFNEWLSRQPVTQTVELLQSARIAAGPVSGMREVLSDPHLEARQWWQSTSVNGRMVRMPGAPFRIEGISWSARPAVAGDRSTVPPPRTAAATSTSSISAVEPEALSDSSRRPLNGLRVLDLTRVWAGPLAARILSELGADVVMVEARWARTPEVMPDSYVQASHFFPDDDQFPHPWNRHGFINKFALTKRSVGLDISTTEGQDVLARLIANADVLIENYSPRVMPNLGFSEDRLREINPDLLYVTMPGYGRTGPAKDYSAYGPVLDSHAGLSSLMGYPDIGSWKCGIAWPDPVAGIHAAFAVLAALWERPSGSVDGVAGRGRTMLSGRPSGSVDEAVPRGRTIEVAQFETAISMISDRLIEAQLENVEPTVLGNRHETHAPQGVYRSSGSDSWLAISISDDPMWQRLCAHMEFQGHWIPWSEDARMAHHNEIDQAITTWTRDRNAADSAAALQAQGVAAGPVADAAMLMNDRHLHSRGYFVDLAHPEAGTHSWGPTCAARLSATPAAMHSAAPCLGQHNQEILSTWAGLDQAAIDSLMQLGVVADRPS